MSVTRQTKFSPDLVYATGAGCLKCGTNQGECFDLGVNLDLYGTLSLCFDHARECGIAAGLVDPDVAGAATARALELLDAAAEAEKRAVVEADTASADREAIERLLKEYAGAKVVRLADKAPAQTEDAE
jgi:recombinational DNA repair protein (RecF pathway)